MLSLTQRVIVLTQSALLVVGLLLVGLFRWQQQDAEGQPPQLPLPGQIAAIADLVERGAPDDLPQLLQAINSPGLRVYVLLADEVPIGGQGRLMPALTRLSERYMQVLGDRSVRVETRRGVKSLVMKALRRNDADAYPMRFVVGLVDGRSLVVEPGHEVVGRLVRMRLAWGLLVVIALVGLLVAWSLHRQFGPLDVLAQAVGRFSGDGDESPVAEAGASQVRSLTRRFNEMRARIRGLLDARTRLLSALGHDLGTYLTRLRLRVEYIADETQRRHAERDIEDMHAVLKDTLMLARRELAAQPPEVFDLGALARAQVEALAASGLPVRLVHCDEAKVSGHITALIRALLNLIDNAVKYAGSAEVSVIAGAERVEMRVDDHGPGISPKERQLVLEPFYRCDASRNLDCAGSGLGLAIVADIVTRHCGELSLDDRPGGGLRVAILLPLARPDAASASEALPHRMVAGPSSGRKRATEGDDKSPSQFDSRVN
ncbi:MAG: HAMP domain-containing sensor histidine kinase [Pseudomonadota bacterium]|nr:HAMP domain-containing sensor histidine kinase [Pseudomonadota bacterium]